MLDVKLLLRLGQVPAAEIGPSGIGIISSEICLR